VVRQPFLRAAFLTFLLLGVSAAIVVPRNATAEPDFQQLPTPTPGGALTLSISVTSGAAGNVATVSWRNLVSPSQRVWIGLFFPGDPDSTALTRMSITCAAGAGVNVTSLASGSCASRIPYTSGRFEFRLVRELAPHANTALARSAVIAVGDEAVPALGARVSADRIRVEAGAALNVSWSGITAPNAGDQVALVAGGGPTDSRFVGCGEAPTVAAPTGSCRIPIPESREPGEYSLQLIGAAGDVLATAGPIQVLSSQPGLSVSSKNVTAGQPFTVSWVRMPDPLAQDWLGLFPRGAEVRSYLDWVYTSCSRMASDSAPASGSCLISTPFDTSTGTYELRYISARGGFHTWSLVELDVTALPPTPTRAAGTPTPRPSATAIRL
jgi:hypothetical protein